MQNRAKEVLKTQAETVERTSTLHAQTFSLNDSSETISIVEILPSSALKFTPATGFSIEASSIRIFTKRKTGKSQAAELLMSQKTNTDYKTATTSIKENKATTTQKNKMSKIPVFLVLVVAVLSGVLLFIVFRYRKMLKTKS